MKSRHEVKMTCIFCHIDEPNSHDLKICSSCATILAQLSQDQLQRGYNKAVELGFMDKAEIFKSLMEAENEPRNRYTSKRFNRKGTLRATGNDQRAGFGFKKQKRTALYQSQRTKQAVL